MKKILYIILSIFITLNYSFSDEKIISISEGNENAKIKLIVYESLTCGHCAEFHKKIYPNIKKDFIDNGLVKIEYRSFPLDMLALNASKIAHCKNDGSSEILHFLFKNQNQWLKGNTVEEANLYLKNLLNDQNINVNFDTCINNKHIEDYVLENRIKGVKKFKINATPTLIINDKKFEDPFNYKKIKKTLEKLI